MLACWGDTVRVGAITEAKQKEFAQNSIAKGNSLSYVSRNLSVLAACANSRRDHTESNFRQAANDGSVGAPT